MSHKCDICNTTYQHGRYCKRNKWYYEALGNNEFFLVSNMVGWSQTYLQQVMCFWAGKGLSIEAQANCYNTIWKSVNEHRLNSWNDVNSLRQGRYSINLDVNDERLSEALDLFTLVKACCFYGLGLQIDLLCNERIDL